jgi:SOS-response transcriptional repressor LexA
MMATPVRLRPITSRQTSVLATIDALWTERGIAPTVREIAQREQFAESTVQHHLVALLARGLIRKARRSPRSIVLTEKGRTTIGTGALTRPSYATRLPDAADRNIA